MIRCSCTKPLTEALAAAQAPANSPAETATPNCQHVSETMNVQTNGHDQRYIHTVQNKARRQSINIHHPSSSFIHSGCEYFNQQRKYLWKRGDQDPSDSNKQSYEKSRYSEAIGTVKPGDEKHAGVETQGARAETFKQQLPSAGLHYSRFNSSGLVHDLHKSDTNSKCKAGWKHHSVTAYRGVGIKQDLPSPRDLPAWCFLLRQGKSQSSYS